MKNTVDSPLVEKAYKIFSYEKKIYISESHPDIAFQFVENLTHPGKNPEQLTVSSHDICKWKCEVNENHFWKATVYSRTKGSGCPKCSCSGSSQKEQDLADRLVKEIAGRTPMETSVRNVINGEIDIFFPDKNIGIEFNGLFWHSEEQGKDKNYHLDKTRQCRKKGIRLIHVWENEWDNNPDVVIKGILNRLGLSDEEKIGARKMDIRLINKKEAEVFLNENHIQGFAAGTYYIGGFYEGKLRSLLVVKKQGIPRVGQWRIERYATLGIVQGGFTRILKYAENLISNKQETITEWVTFSDTCISDGALYKNNGFVKDKELKPDYRYVVDDKRVHKFNYRLKRFRDDTELQYEEGLSEKQLALLNGIPRLWDCGKIRWMRKIKTRKKEAKP